MRTAADLAAFVIVQGCLPMIAGRRPDAPPPEGALIAAAERAALGFTGPGFALAYETADGRMVVDYGAETATLRLPALQRATALEILSAALARAPGDLQQAEEPSGPGGAVLRTYLLRLTERRYARIAASIPPGETGPLELRVTGVAAIGYTSPRAEAA